MKKLSSLLSLLLLFVAFFATSTSTAFGQGSGDCFSHILNAPSYTTGQNISIRYASDGCNYDGQVRTEILRWENVNGKMIWVPVDTRTLRVSITPTSITEGISFVIPYGTSLWRSGHYLVRSQAVNTGNGGFSQIFSFKEVSYFFITGVTFSGLVQPNPEEAGRASLALPATLGEACDGSITFPAILGAGTDTAPAVFYQDQAENQKIYHQILVSKPGKNSIGLQASATMPHGFSSDTPLMVHIVDRGNPTQWVGRDFVIFDPTLVVGNNCLRR